MDCLFKLNYSKLCVLVEETLNIKNWFVRKDTITSRTEAIEQSERYKFLKKQAEKTKIIFNKEEIVTWLDSLNILYFVFDAIEDKNLKDHIKIIQEYSIPYLNKRPDYLLIYDNKILIIEFSFNKLEYEMQYEAKLSQAINYKEILSNLLPKEIDIGTYTFLVEPEEDIYRNTFTIKNTDFYPNHYKIEQLAKYIEKFFKKNINLAIIELNRISQTN